MPQVRSILIFSIALIAASPLGLGAAPPPGTKTATATKLNALSVRVVAYNINAKLDLAKKIITATQTLTYHNLTGQPQQTFPFHMYLNAFQPQSTWVAELNRDHPGGEWKPESFGSITVDRIAVTGMGDVTSKMQFVHPDDDNAADRTVMQVTLPKPVPPGADVQFVMTFTDKLPQVVARTGYIRDFFMVGQWFPKVGVWWNGGWNCHQFHFSTEFFADFGTFDVKITLPQNEIVGAGGELLSSENNSDGTKTLEFHSEDVHDFSWAASPNFQLIEDSWTGSAGPVKIHLLMSPGNMASAPRYLQSLKGALRLFDEWIGPYPYGRITVVDPPHGGLEAGGMEYPTLVTADTTWYMPKSVYLPEVTVVHEFGHQYWYGMVATNEFEDAWLDEGINTYTESKIMDALYGKDTSLLNARFATLGETGDHRAGILTPGYLRWPDTDPITRFGWRFYNDSAYGTVTYSKTALVLTTLEKIIGEETMHRALHTYFMRYRFTHPTGEDFLKTIEEVSGRDLRWYFNQAIFGTNILDYEIASAHSDSLDSEPSKDSGAKSGPEIYRTIVAVRRKGDFIFPVDVAIKFDDGKSQLEHWDGRDRWVRYAYDRPAQLVSAEIDPEHKVPLDLNLYNNSFVVKEDKRAINKLSHTWMFVCEWFGQLLAWLT
ncbi:MAG: M1 family metallopeptidase [Candidatus Acidiferrales bacterium]